MPYSVAAAIAAERLQPLDKYMATNIPPRIFAPGEVPAYSNYGAAVAGYIVQRVSGEKFEDYVRKHIFMPLDMQDASFSQPLEPNLLAKMSSAVLVQRNGLGLVLVASM